MSAPTWPTPSPEALAAMRAEFDARWAAAAAKIDADYASLTDAQRARQGRGRARSARIAEILGAHYSLHRSPRLVQITIARLGYAPEAARGYGPDAALAHLARAGAIVILSDRMRRPGTVMRR